MIFDLQFWRSWPTNLKVLLLVLVGMLVFLLGLLLYFYYADLENILQWDIATELHQKFIVREAFVENGLRFSNNEIVYYLKEWYLASLGEASILPAMLLLIALFTGLSLMFAGLSFQNSSWFLISSVVLAGFLLILRIEIVFQDISNWYFIIGFLSLSGLLFLFNSFWKKAIFLNRIGLILLVFLALFLLLIGFAKVQSPVLALANYGLLFPLLIFAVFVFLIGHEGMALLVWAVSKSSIKGKNATGSFLGFGIIYLLNCVLIYLENIRAIESSLMIANPVFLFILSSILGIWGFRKKTEDMGLFSYRQTGIWVYLGMALISYAVLAFVYATGNDSLTELLNDYIAITHLALGLLFFGHVLVNYIGLFKKGLDVHLVLYKPKLSRLLLAQSAGLFLIGFLLIQKNIYSYSQLRAGLQNAIADFYLAEGESKAAEVYYKESVNYDLFNHKANYALAAMAASVGDGINAAFFYRQALQKNPSEFAYIGLSEHLEKEDLYFDALFNLREGLETFPTSSVIASNTARLLEKASLRDSVYYYLHRATQNCWNCRVEEVNMQSFWIENSLENKLDSVSQPYANSENGVNLANQLAIGKMTATVQIQLDSLLRFTDLNVADFAAIYNQMTMSENAIYWSDTIWNDLINRESNMAFNDDLHFLKSRQAYLFSDKISGIKQLNYLVRDSTQKAMMYQGILGLWYLQEGLYDKALNTFKMAGDSISVRALESTDFEDHLLAKQRQQAEEMLQVELSMGNYQKMLNRAPFNPFLVERIADFLSKNEEESEAYRIVFDALEFADKSVVLWEKYVFLALDNGVADYAENGIDKLKLLLTPEEFVQFSIEVEAYNRALKSWDEKLD